MRVLLNHYDSIHHKRLQLYRNRNKDEHCDLNSHLNKCCASRHAAPASMDALLYKIIWAADINKSLQPKHFIIKHNKYMQAFMYTMCSYIKTDLVQLGTRDILLVIQEDGVCVAMHHCLCSTAENKNSLLNQICKMIIKKTQKLFS